MRTPGLRRSVNRLAGLAALGASLAAPQARAAAEDINAQPGIAAEYSGVVAIGRRLVTTVVESEQAVVQAIKENAKATWSAPSWNLAADRPYAGRAVDYVTRANASAAAATAANGPGPAGIADLSFGAKLRVLHGDADLHIPMVSWMTDVQPGAGLVSGMSSALRPSMHLSAEWSLPGDFSLGVMPGMAVDLDASGRRTANGTLAVTVGKAWTPQWRTFLDMARDRLAAVQLGGTSTTLDAGVSFLASSSTQLDLALTHGLSSSAPAFQAGVGVSSSF